MRRRPTSLPKFFSRLVTKLEPLRRYRRPYARKSSFPPPREFLARRCGIARIGTNPRFPRILASSPHRRVPRVVTAAHRSQAADIGQIPSVTIEHYQPRRCPRPHSNSTLNSEQERGSSLSLRNTPVGGCERQLISELRVSRPAPFLVRGRALRSCGALSRRMK